MKNLTLFGGKNKSILTQTINVQWVSPPH